MSLAAMTPQGKLSSTYHVLANTNPANAEFLVYAPYGGSFTVNLSGLTGKFKAEWMNPSSGAKTPEAMVSSGAERTFTPPFTGDAVLYLKLSK